jgi:hypothetical protein
MAGNAQGCGFGVRFGRNDEKSGEGLNEDEMEEDEADASNKRGFIQNPLALLGNPTSTKEEGTLDVQNNANSIGVFFSQFESPAHHRAKSRLGIRRGRR